MILNFLRQAPAKARDNADLGSMQCFAVLSLTQGDRLCGLHNLDVVQIARRATNRPTKWIDFRFLEDPRLCTRDDALRRPSWEGSTFEEEACGAQRAAFCRFTRDDIAGDNMGGVWIWIAQEKGERYNWPWVVVSESLGKELHDVILS